MDVVDQSEKLDTVILCSGDGDFVPLVKAIARRGKHTEVCGLREMTSTDLIASADVYTDLASLKENIALDHQPQQREIRNEIETSADGFDESRVQDTTSDF